MVLNACERRILNGLELFQLDLRSLVLITHSFMATHV